MKTFITFVFALFWYVVIGVTLHVIGRLTGYNGSLYNDVLKFVGSLFVIMILSTICEWMIDKIVKREKSNNNATEKE